jgi:hypothetical protein
MSEAFESSQLDIITDFKDVRVLFSEAGGAMTDTVKIRLADENLTEQFKHLFAMVASSKTAIEFNPETEL